MRTAGRVVVLGLVVGALGACSSSSPRSAGSSTTSQSVPSNPVTSAGRGTVPPKAPSARWATYYGDTARTGLASDGPASAGNARRQWTSTTLDGDVYAQPLVVGDRVIVATEHNTVYSLNVTDGSVAWTRHLGAPVPGSSLPCGDVDPVGITGTPVMDPLTNRIYAVGLFQPRQHMLFELDATNGRVVASSRVDATGSDAAVQNQRGALTLSNGKVFIPYGGRYGDCGDYHGRVVSVAVSRTGLGPVTSYTLPTEREGGFWSPPGAVVGTDGSLFLASGNSSSRGTYDYGNSVVRLEPSLHLVDSWAPSDWAKLNAGDADIGSTSPVMLPHSRVFQIGKTGIGYLLDAGHLGGIRGELLSDDVCGGSGVFGGIAHDGDTMFVPCLDAVVQVQVDGNGFKTGWSARMSTPGPTVIAGGAVWTVATGSGDLVALDRSSGHTLISQRLGRVPSRFTSPALGDGRVVVAAGAVVSAFGS
jgi:outer membrane protein assembly factor BamB